MRIPSAYKVYQVVFGYSEGQDGARIAFGRAIAETLPVIRKVLESGSIGPVKTYKQSEYARKLAVQFLDHFLDLADGRSRFFAKRWHYTDAVIKLDRTHFPFTRRRGLDIGFPFLTGPERTEIIIPTFGPPKNMSGELGVLQTLCTVGRVTPALATNTQTITYWDLLHGAECRLQRAEITPVDPGIVLSACSRLLAS